ncbi:MAG TPA: anaerobic ribonucleoside-triphosphate reductase [Opitutaceae bacterium]
MIATETLPATRTQTVTLTDAERQPCEVWTRVMGYHRPVSSFNIGKKGEHQERRFFQENRCGLN